MTLPLPAGEWILDRAHTTIGFAVRHLGISKVRGRFTGFRRRSGRRARHRVVVGPGVRVDGILGLNGRRRPLSLDVECLVSATFPGDGTSHVGVAASGALSRKAYGVDFNVPLAAGGFVIADQVAIELDVQLMPLVASAA